MMPGDFDYVHALGVGPKALLPSKGYTWVRDYNMQYWEVAEADLEAGVKDEK